MTGIDWSAGLDGSKNKIWAYAHAQKKKMTRLEERKKERYINKNIMLMTQNLLLCLNNVWCIYLSNRV
jgi:hypothetical protein